MDEVVAKSRGELLVEQLARFRPDGVSLNGWAVRARVGRTVWADIRRHGNPSRRTLQKLLDAANSSLAEFEALAITDLDNRPDRRDDSALGLTDGAWGWKGAPLIPLPLHRCTAAGTWGPHQAGLWRVDRSKVDAYVPRPPSLSGQARALAFEVPDEIMAPRFRRGHRIVINFEEPAVTGKEVCALVERDGPCDLYLPGVIADIDSTALQIAQYGGGALLSIPLDQLLDLVPIVGELI